MAIVALCRRLIAGSGFFPRSSGGTLCSVMQLVVLGVVLLLALSAPLICGSASGGMGRPPRASRTSFRCLLGSGRAVFLDPLVSLMVRMGLESLRSGSSAVSLVLFTVTLLSKLHYARAAAVQLPHGVAAGLGVPIAARGPAAAPSGGESGDGSDDGPEYTADQLLDFESEASAIAAEFLAQF